MPETDNVPTVAQVRCARLRPAPPLGSPRGRFPLVLGAAALAVVGARQPAYAQPPVSETQILFDIPAQALGPALEAYGATTGLAVFYDAGLAVGRRSTIVKGRFSPFLGLEVLLRGTGYASRMTGPDAVSIAPAESGTTSPTAAAEAMRRRYEPYFAVLQARVGQALCGSDRAKPESDAIIFRFWLAASGVIARAEIVGSDSASAGDRAVAAGIQGIKVGEPPPGLPQPVTMAVFPPSAGEAPGCPALHGKSE